MFKQGYMKDHSVQITWAMQIAENAECDPAIIVNGFEETITEFGNKNGISISLSMTDSDDAVFQAAQQTDQQAVQQTEQKADIIDGSELEDEWEWLDNITIERDANGNIVKYIETDSAGSQLIYNAQKQLICARINTDSGYMEINCDENGQVIGNEDREPVEAWEMMDHITVERDADGNVIRYISTDSRGSKVTYNAQKQRVYAWICLDDGHAEIYYDENGQIATHTSFGNNGSVTEIYYYPSGNRKQTYTVFANGEFLDIYYSESGSQIKRISRINLPDGAYQVDYDTSADGITEYQYVYSPDGTIWYNIFDANGNQIGQTQVK